MLEMDLEQYRTFSGYSYRQLASWVGDINGPTARLYALGKIWPNAERLETIINKSDGAITLSAMHRRHLEYKRSKK